MSRQSDWRDWIRPGALLERLLASASSSAMRFIDRLRRTPRRPSSAPLLLPRSGSGVADDTEAAGYTPPGGLLSDWFTPLNIQVKAELSTRPTLNVLVPGLGIKHMSGGPNTVVNLAYRLAALGVPIRLISTNVPIDANPSAFWS